MTDSALPSPGLQARADRRHAASSSFTPLRTVAALAFLAAAVLLLAGNDAVRAAEAAAAAHPIGLAVPGDAVASGDIVVFQLGRADVLGMRISFMCSTVVLAAPLLLAAAAVTPFGRFAARGLAQGLAGSLLIVVVANLLRFTLIAFAYATWGREGFDLSHHVVGSLVVIVAFVAASAYFVRSVGRGRS